MLTIEREEAITAKNKIIDKLQKIVSSLSSLFIIFSKYYGINSGHNEKTFAKIAKTFFLIKGLVWLTKDINSLIKEGHIYLSMILPKQFKATEHSINLSDFFNSF